MPIHDIVTLYSRAIDIMVIADLTPAERSEVMNIAQGFGCEESATAERVPAEAIRACRERIHEKLGALHAGTLMSTLETLAGVNPGGPGSGTRARS